MEQELEELRARVAKMERQIGWIRDALKDAGIVVVRDRQKPRLMIENIVVRGEKTMCSLPLRDHGWRLVRTGETRQ